MRPLGAIDEQASARQAEVMSVEVQRLTLILDLALCVRAKVCDRIDEHDAALLPAAGNLGERGGFGSELLTIPARDRTAAPYRPVGKAARYLEPVERHRADQHDTTPRADQLRERRVELVPEYWRGVRVTGPISGEVDRSEAPVSEDLFQDRAVGQGARRTSGRFIPDHRRTSRSRLLDQTLRANFSERIRQFGAVAVTPDYRVRARRVAEDGATTRGIGVMTLGAPR